MTKNKYINQLITPEDYLSDLNDLKNLQHGLIPRKSININGINITNFYRPSAYLSGDFIDYVVMEKNKIGVFIIDIVGKGIKSSYATIWLKALFQREINKGISNSPKKIMTALNNAMYSETNLSIRYGSGFYASIDTQNYTIKYCDCGIGVANLYRKSTISELRDYGGIGIGWANNSIYTDGSITLKKHDVIMLSTDGIENIINDCGKKVGPQLLNQLILKRNKNVSLIQSISKGINSLSNQSIKDDIALVCIEC